MFLPGSYTKISILMLHEFGHSGDCFAIKTRPLAQELKRVLAELYRTKEDNISFIYPDGSISLDGSASTSAHGVSERSNGSNIYAWSRYNDVSDSTQYVGVDQSLLKIERLCNVHGPFTGIMRFSTGATLASMFASWCECDSTSGRRDALRRMYGTGPDHDLVDILHDPPQRPLDFAIFCSGFPGTPDFCGGFYEPKITTPSVHLLGSWDTMVTRTKSLELAGACHRPIIVEHKKVHHVPRDRITMVQIADAMNILRSPFALEPSFSTSSHEDLSPAMPSTSQHDFPEDHSR